MVIIIIMIDASLMTDLGSYINIRGGGVGWDSS